MRYKVCLVLTLVAFVMVGRAPGIRELRNPDAEHGAGARTVIALKRSMV
ncbi:MULTISPECIES: hypothetical protein [Methylobacterium]|uniref:Uncharacterized protein n=1 Tax=Methylobacterium thuringiense TaxID=1003091 RepID=A0ABQ4TP32_9HYPH|nr:MULTISPECIES: hypothetical protein [Methylobacterium]GJE56756.1 hypothetical protein EKPJFOCH_3264 [Methylobacterium thuringiense]